jgi:hypothetical protein
MKRTAPAVLVLIAVLAALAYLVPRRPRPELPEPTREPPPSPEILSSIPLEDDHRIGAPMPFGRLTVFPVLAADQPDLGPFTTLDDALEGKNAEVREVGGADSGTVRSLVIENKGDVPIFVLAGTVVKGGRQDRQIAQDFVVGPRQEVAVDAFCVERGRWNPTRDGALTQGKFGTMKTLANSSVRAAGQHKKDQSEVWSKTGEVNAKNGKSSPTGSLAASIDDQELTPKRAALADRLATSLNGLRPQREIVGVAYAIDGRVRGVRWFANHRLYELHRATLLQTAALEAITAERAGAPPPEAAAPITAEAVKTFVTEIEGEKVAEERPTAGENINDYRESKKGYGSSAKFKPGSSIASATSKEAPPPGAPSAAKKKPISISSDFVAKD